MTRALIAARKSTKVDGHEGHSLHTQDQHSRAFCERLDWEVVGVASDTISGRVAPIDRKELGRWLAEPHRFDLVVAYRSDRLSRGNQEDWTRIEHWATENRKGLVVVDAATGVRYPARDDSDFWQWTAMKRQAGREWDEIRERNLRSQAALVATGALTGGAPFGYRITGDKYAKRLEIYEPEAAVVREVFARVKRGESLKEVGAWYSEATGRSAHGNVIRSMIMSWAYAGRLERNGVHYADCPAIIGAGELVAAQQAMRSRATKSRGGRRPGLEPALMVMVCGECGCRMYRMRKHYTCVGPSHTFTVPHRKAENAVLLHLRSSTEDEVLPQVVRGRNYEDEIETFRRDRRQALERDDIEAVLSLTEKIKDLESRDVEPDRVEPLPTGRTYGKKFTDMSREAIRRELRAWIITAYPNGMTRVTSPWKAVQPVETPRVREATS